MVMNEVVARLEGKWNFDAIHESLVEEFAIFVMGSYEAFTTYLDYPRIETFLYADNSEFDDTFWEPYLIYEESIKRANFPEENWEELSDWQNEEYAELLMNARDDLAYEFVQDVKVVLNAFQMFHITDNEEQYYDGLKVLEFNHSPLQEVW